MRADQSLAEAYSSFLRANGLASGGGQDERTWTCRLGPIALVLPNFEWRKRAIARHDLHHVLTGYECNLLGEFEMAAWEFAAGRFDHFYATAFCLPLVLAGALATPRRTFAAFVRGRASRTLYDAPVDAALLESPLAAVRQRYAPLAPPIAGARDRIAFAKLLVEAITLLISPALAAAALLLVI